MKRILMSIAMVALTITAAQAQENKDKTEITTVKKVTQKDTDVKTKVIKETKTEKGILKVEGTKAQDQASHVIKKSDVDTEVTDNVAIDVANQRKMMAIKEKQEAALAAKIAAQNEAAATKAERERKEKLAQQQKEIEARRAALMQRPEGMAKLKKD